MRPAHPAVTPEQFPGLDPAWSRTVSVSDSTGVKHDWHVLDNGVRDPVGTLLCVHGNPTWSYLWRRMFSAAPPGWRVVAPDHLGMGYSTRLTSARTLRQRVEDLGDLTDALDVTGPVVTLAHDWGGPISLGWALSHRSQLSGLVLTNTAIAQPDGDLGPALIRVAHSPILRKAVCVRTPTFVLGATALSWPPLPSATRRALAAPYSAPARRASVGEFVADIPFTPDHLSRPTLERIAADVSSITEPALFLWGPRDPVFSEKYLADLRGRLPQARLHRYERASHLVTEDAPEYAAAVAQWLQDLKTQRGRPGATDSPGPAIEPGTPASDVAAHTSAREVAPAGGTTSRSPVAGDLWSASPVAGSLWSASPVAGSLWSASPVAGSLWSALDARASDSSPAVVEVGGMTVSWSLLAQRVKDLAAGLAVAGVRPGDRVALLLPPSADLTAVVYAVWRAGGVIVVADKGLGFTGMRRALRSAAIDHVVASAQGLAAARMMSLPGSRIAASGVPGAAMGALGADRNLAGVAELGRGRDLPDEPSADQDCAVVFTSGATGPAKGVVYRHRQVLAQIELLRSTYAITSQDRMVAAFAPFALLGPALGIGSAVPDIDVTAPGTLSAPALAEAVAGVEATIVFASPAALRNVASTASDLSAGQRSTLGGVRLLMSAGAPVPAPLLHSLRAVLPAAQAHTPYGMTEVLPVTDISLTQIDAAGPGRGVCVGLPVSGVELALSPLSSLGVADGALSTTAGLTGEICVRAAHVKDRYDSLWATERASSRDPGWHRTGDVGQLDVEGRLWVEGRLSHVIATAEGVVTPVGLEQRVEQLPNIAQAAVVGVGPAGSQVVVPVVVLGEVAASRVGALGRATRLRFRPDLELAGNALADAVRAAAGTDVSAVLVARRLPLDIRHQSKIDRREVSRWASRFLAGSQAHRSARGPGTP